MGREERSRMGGTVGGMSIFGFRIETAVTYR
jgi:hypothetical protein